jgi:uncharacterized protein YgbK (DUF1537 family)
MTVLAILADDFTGALDTGVQFSQYGANVQIVALEKALHAFTPDGAEVVVVDAGTRHLPGADAYRLMRRLSEGVKRAGIPYLYLKTDSGLRGNIGSALKAALDAGAARFLPFLPAFPDMNRVTVNGVQFVDGAPVHESVFGGDPFEPVRSPYVKDLFAGLDVNVAEFPAGAAFSTDFNKPTVGIFDAESGDDFRSTARYLQQKGLLGAVAGCAGFAAVYREFLPLTRNNAPQGGIERPLLVVSGSVNPIARQQIEHAERDGFIRIELTPKQLLTDNYFLSLEGEAWIESQRALFRSGRPVTIDTGFSRPERMQAYLDQRAVSQDEARGRIAWALGTLTRRLVDAGCAERHALMIVGGDTLQGFLQQLEWEKIVPVCELALGTVLSRVHARGRVLPLISKSGAFGPENLLTDLNGRTCGAESGGSK